MTARDALPRAAQPVRVGIADDHAITRRALRELLAHQPGIEVAGEAASGRDAVELCRRAGLHVLLLDLEMPGQGGMDVIRHIVARAGAPAVLVLSGHPAATYGVQMMRKGAAGYLGKGCEPQEIARAIRVVASGRRYCDGELLALLADKLAPAAEAPHDALTHRELQVFVRLARGQSCDGAAADLSLSPATVTTYRSKLMAKMGLRTTSEMTYYAVKHGLID